MILLNIQTSPRGSKSISTAATDAFVEAYESQREEPHNRALSRAQGVHVRLGGTGAVGDGLPPKPKGMHWTTYKKLAGRFLRLEAAMDSAAAVRFDFGL